ncbi:MAG: 5-methylcytosine-specific restriction enzyme subunit McrC [Clostridium sp.]|jgi:5-methylcytosine-specific restriction enzyme subunit McrC
MSEINNYKLKIPIKNIYYMLSYAFGVLRQDGFAQLSSEDFENIYELLCEILINGIREQLKRGIYKEYNLIEEEIPVLRGKISITDSIKLKAVSSTKLHCIYDEFSSNNILNQILKTTCLALVRNSNVNSKQKKKLKNLMMYFEEVSEVSIKTVEWKKLNYHRNNLTYKMLINICYLIWEGLIVNEQNGKYKFMDFIKDKQMAKLYEKFIYEFYKKECPGVSVNYQQKISWKTDDGYIDLLPGMSTDISLTKNNHRIIIDTKFYPQAMQKNYLSENKTFISSNLYQIFAYVKNSAFNGEVSGMLLYPTVDYDLNHVYKLSGNNVFIKTVDLNKNFKDISKILRDIGDLV